LKQKLKTKKKVEWYKQLIEELKKTERATVFSKWLQGKKIRANWEKFGKPEYGDKRIENLAKDLKRSVGEIRRIIKFAEKYSEFSHVVRELKDLSWHEIANNYLYEKGEKPKLPALPKGKYNIIYADPPWKYWEGGYKNQQQHYGTLDLSIIKEMKDINGRTIQDIQADECVLFLWATFPYIEEALEVIKNWGFDYSTVVFVWFKTTKSGKPFFGLGRWTRSNVEVCLLGRKGSIPRQDASISQIIISPVEEHSKKPDIVRDKIVQLIGELPRIELFARQKTEGWDVWGKEVDE